jgi:hypothetical protein
MTTLRRRKVVGGRIDHNGPRRRDASVLKLPRPGRAARDGASSCRNLGLLRQRSGEEVSVEK